MEIFNGIATFKFDATMETYVDGELLEQTLDDLLGHESVVQVSSCWDKNNGGRVMFVTIKLDVSEDAGIANRFHRLLNDRCYCGDGRHYKAWDVIKALRDYDLAVCYD